jgi:DNA-binding response OmpR family regulator
MAMKELVILLAEDNPGDALLFQEALGYAGIAARLIRVQDGISATDYLRRSGKGEDAPRPDLLVLDMNLPGKSGIGIMEEIRASAELNDVPIVLFTGSKDAAKACDNFPGIRCMSAVKPFDPFELVTLIRTFVRFAAGESDPAQTPSDRSE